VWVYFVEYWLTVRLFVSRVEEGDICCCCAAVADASRD
jgi:hypothetical protein